MKMKKFNRMIRRFLVLCLCLALLAGSACAEEMKSICSGLDHVYYSCTLEDGRLLLTGVKNRTTSDYYDPVAWVVCLNPDGTVSWEFDDQGADGYSSVVQAAALRDGNVAMVFEDRQLLDREDRITIRFFAKDGQPTGKELPIPTDCVTFRATPSWLMLNRWKKEERINETLLIDWGGNELLRYDGLILPGGYGDAVENTEELVFFGMDKMEHSHAKILKLDGFTDTVLWETTLDWQLPGTEEGRISSCVRTDDGGYLAWVEEAEPVKDDEWIRWKPFLVKFDAEGRVLWINREICEKHELLGSCMCFHDGKVMIPCVAETDEDPDGIAPWLFLWLDEDGNELGTTKVELNIGDLQVASQYVGPAGDGTNWELCAYLWDLIPMTDGLLALGLCDVERMDGEEYQETIPEASETFLVRIPEP